MKQKHTILVVEDDESTLRLLELYLQGAGYETLTALDGSTALELVKSAKPSLVVLDLMLPEVHGIGVCHTIKSHPDTKQIKVLVVSVKSFPADQRQAYEAGADFFMAKPVEKNDFLKAVRALLNINVPS
ncbi:MAG: response regulator [Elusimicrobia bacterium]|nr:response regulator [Elusimicrobiota bacterium]